MKLRGYRQHRATGEVWAVESEDNVDVGCVGRFPKGTPMPPARLLRLSEHGLFPYRVHDSSDWTCARYARWRSSARPRGAAQRQHGPRLVHGGVPDVEDEVGRAGRDDDRARVASLLEADSRVTETAGGI